MGKELHVIKRNLALGSWNLSSRCTVPRTGQLPAPSPNLPTRSRRSPFKLIWFGFSVTESWKHSQWNWLGNPCSPPPPPTSSHIVIRASNSTWLMAHGEHEGVSFFWLVCSFTIVTGWEWELQVTCFHSHLFFFFKMGQWLGDSAHL